MSRLTYLALTCATMLTLAACSDNDADEAWDSVPADKVAVELTIRMKVSTLDADDVDYTEEAGTAWENYIDMHGDDYRIYFFTSNASSAENNTLIAELEPTSVISTSGSEYVTYTIWGELDGSFAATTDFKVVVAANWGTYPETTPGTTTMQTLCTAGTYSALVDTDTDTDGKTKAVLPSSSKHIPFYGVQDYTGVDWRLGHTTSLSGGITMVRAMAKVEVVLNDDEGSLSSVTLNRYNATGYCAPLAYTATRDDVEYALHLVNNGNDSGEKTLAFVKTQDRETDSNGNVTQQETWTAYVPEYSNMGEDYSTITLTSDDRSSEPTTIYFGQYHEDGKCTAYDTGGNTSDRFDISRNYCYRFHVTFTNNYLQVDVDKWEAAFDDEWTFGIMSTE